MTRPSSGRRSVPRAKAADFAHVAAVFHQGAEAAKEFEYWNAAGLLMVHAAIAYTDAVTVKVGGVKSVGEDHGAAVDLLGQVVALDEAGRKAARHLARLIEEKNVVAYSGEIYRREDVDRLWKHLQRYSSWARGMLEP